MKLKLLVGLALAAALNLSAAELVHLDAEGVVRWNADNREVALFGANYSLASACDYRAAGYVGADRKKLVEQDLQHFARMGWDGIRLCLWGDWENSDAQGNLIVNDHLDVMDYAIAVAKQRGIYILLTPITTYAAWWPDAKADTPYAGFSKHFDKSKLGTDPAAIAAQVNYLKQILNHVNPYTGVALKDEPQIIFVEMINEPQHHADDFKGSVAYINALAEAVRSTGCTKILFHNLSQDIHIAPAIRASTVPGLTFAWYPTGLNVGHELVGSYLRTVDDFTPMHREDLRGAPKIVYEFDSADMNSGYMYPAMVRAFRGVGAQFAAMFSYDMLATAPYNLGWQTHFLNLVYSPKKAMSAVIAAEVMRRVPRYADYGAYPGNTRFGPFRVSAEEDGSELVTADTFLHANTTHTAPPAPDQLRRIAGTGSSPIVSYAGNGAYFLDQIADGVWRLEVYPDTIAVADPFAQHVNYQTPAIRLAARERPMTVELPGLGESFTVTPLNEGNGRHAKAVAGKFIVTPGVYLLSRAPYVDAAKLPSRVGQIGLREFVCPPAPAEPLPPEIPVAKRTTAGQGAPLALFDAAADIPALVYTRIGDTVRHGIFKSLPATASDPAALRLMLPLSMDKTLDDYTASLAIKDRIAGHGDLAAAKVLHIKARAATGGEVVHVTLVETDGTAWSAALTLAAGWSDFTVPLGDLKLARGVKLPLGYPERWNYWIEPATGRGTPGDRVNPAAIEHVQISLRPVATTSASSGDSSVDVASIELGSQ